jgi:hypothetical protein
LYVGSTLVGQVPGVTVAAGGLVSVVFSGLSNATTGPVTYTVIISGAVPGEFNTSNNSGSATVEFTNPTPEVNQSYYNLQYYLTRNYHNHYTYNDYYNGTLLYEWDETADWEGLYYNTYTYSGSVTSAGQPITVDYKIETSDNRVFSGSFTDVAPFYTDGYYSYYESYDVTNHLYLWSSVDLNGYMQTTINRYLSNYMYVWNYYTNSYYYYNNSGSYSYSDGLSNFLNEQSQLKVSMVTDYDGYSYGGGALLTLPALQTYSWSSSWTGYWYYDYWYYTYITVNQIHTYDQTYNSSWGLTDPYMLPKAGVLDNPRSQELTFGLDKVYQSGSTATVQFSLGEEAPYTLNVVDMQGREALRMVEGTQAAGLQTKQLDVSALKPGVYVFRLQSGKNVETKKIVLN